VIANGSSDISPLRRRVRGILGLASRVSGLGFELETPDSVLGTENYISANSVRLG
jgi:hypothetical protein